MVDFRFLWPHKGAFNLRQITFLPRTIVSVLRTTEEVGKKFLTLFPALKNIEF
jgi:hypothetical protein